ncbi:MAG: methylenetetrahydrofolate reductase C-terminal domain-containing protein [Elusimicrobiota bacterium]|nr:methylenetetrahydrofolate reductase C-terminal domain-containing protein [Endomicrobiia bacterium]MDW8166770.1 methylenetetrahydrofolate reductase C-terminal domain-containing protein [Elusimicrobiota bacterium]
MFVIKPKPEKEILDILFSYKNLLYIICNGCNEVSLYLKDALSLYKSLNKYYRVLIKIIDYLCNLDFADKYIVYLSKEIENIDAIVIFSCGVGVATFASKLEKDIFIVCDTFYLTGYKGLNTPYEGKFDCTLCGSCYLNYTASICPITSCLKSLLNGPCGGAKNGKCEVDKTKDCGWEKIILKLKKYNKLNQLKEKILIHKFNKLK